MISHLYGSCVIRMRSLDISFARMEKSNKMGGKSVRNIHSTISLFLEYCNAKSNQYHKFPKR